MSYSSYDSGLSRPSSPVSVSWIIDRTVDPSILEELEFVQNNQTIIIYNNIENGTSILNTFVSVNIQENMELTAEQCDCCICMEDIVQSDICRFSCDHTFCGNCCSSSLQSKFRCNEKMRCPLCREEVTSVHVQNNENRDKFIVSH